MAYLNFKAIYELLGQFSIRYPYHFTQSVDNFEIHVEHKTL